MNRKPQTHKSYKKDLINCKILLEIFNFDRIHKEDVKCFNITCWLVLAIKQI